MKTKLITLALILWALSGCDINHCEESVYESRLQANRMTAQQQECVNTTLSNAPTRFMAIKACVKRDNFYIALRHCSKVK